MKLAAAAGLTAILGVAPAAGLPPLAASASVAPPTAGARPAVLTVRLHYGMTCGYPGPGPVVVAFPAQWRLPGAIERAAVLVDGKPAYALRTFSHFVTVGLPPPPKVLCQSFTFGTLTLTFTSAAKLGNPVRAGTYPLLVRRQRDRFHVSVAVVP